MSNQIPVVNEHDEIIDYRDRATRLGPNDIYRVSALWITNRRGEVLLARRAYTKSHDPGMWSPAVAGTVEEGETYQSNIVKEAEEELGIVGVEFSPEVKYLRRGQKHSYFVQPFSVVLDWPLERFRPRAEEVAEVRWFSKAELARQLREQPDEFLASIRDRLEKLTTLPHG